MSAIFDSKTNRVAFGDNAFQMANDICEARNEYRVVQDAMLLLNASNPPPFQKWDMMYDLSEVDEKENEWSRTILTGRTNELTLEHIKRTDYIISQTLSTMEWFRSIEMNTPQIDANKLSNTYETFLQYEEEWQNLYDKISNAVIEESFMPTVISMVRLTWKI